MIDETLRKKLTKEQHKIIYEPRTGEEMENALDNRAPIYKYSELCQMAKKHGPTRLLVHMFSRSNDNVILLQDPSDMSSGHWISVSRNIPKKQIYFFSTYGGKPDAEKVSWMNEDDLRQSGQYLNIFSDGLRDLQKHGWEIHYNDYPYQKAGDNTATCGIFTAAFLRSGKDPDIFHKETLQLEKEGRNPAIVYYNRYFR